MRILARDELTHKHIIARLTTMLPLMEWLSVTKNDVLLGQVRNYYKKAMKEQYKRDIELFFQHARFWVKQEVPNTKFLGNIYSIPIIFFCLIL